MTDRLKNKLKARATAWAGQLTKLAKLYAPNHVKKAIKSHVEDGKDGKYIIRTSVDMEIAPDAMAQEYGSGLRARRGVKAKYPIYPKKGKFLAFNWDIANENPEQFTFLPDGRVRLSKVMHPGIAAVNHGDGYIRLAQRELRKRGKAELSEDVHDAIVGDLRESFTRRKTA